MSGSDQSSRRGARKVAAREGISYTSARRQLIELGHWGRGQRFFDELIADLDARGESLKDLVDQHRAGSGAQTSGGDEEEAR
ncbi:hypothetical protein [Kribbella sp. NPDC006257]|uniref:hypothetical protein n=1 Tax=Kribbella sp. NPDC006257 TaxID=3156738 RepID=UPI0033AE4346